MLNRGGLNLDYNKGFQIEAEKFTLFKPTLLKLLTASNIELVTRGMLDTDCGIDAIAKIDNQHFFIGLRFRTTLKDYNSITLSRHFKDNASEIKKFLFNKVRPDFFIQITEVNNDVRITEINIDAFIMYLQFLIKNNQLENHYNEKLKAYEFKLKNFELGEHGIRNYLIEKNKVFT
jgi:hypothetical protein